MFETIFLVVAFIGSVGGGIYDLKTTDMLDIIPYSMIIIALILHGTEAFISGDYWLILNSVIYGVGLLVFGYVMYFFGQWGAGDAWMLSAIGFLLSEFKNNMLFPFPISYLFNVFFIGTAYMLVYATVISFMNKKIIFEFKKEMKASTNVIVISSFILFFGILSLDWYLNKFLYLTFSLNSAIFNSLLILVVTISMFVVWKFAQAVENIGFKKRIPVSKLKIGDVLLESRLFRGLTEKEVKKIKKTKRFVWVKEGVRFAPTFPLSLLFTIFYGDALFLFLKFFI